MFKKQITALLAIAAHGENILFRLQSYMIIHDFLFLVKHAL